MGMSNSVACPPSVRPLYAWEIHEVRRVFAEQIDYARVRIHECTPWPDRVNTLGLRLKRMPPNPHAHNAITIGDHCYFPVKLPAKPLQAAHPEHYKLCWLVHELTHVWQFQHLGWRYLAMAVNVQIRQGAQAYDFGGETGLLERLNQGWRLADFNLEQQGDIASSYYQRICHDQETRAWLPFVSEFQQAKL